MVIAEDMLDMGGESNADGNDDEDAVVVSFVYTIVALTRCGGGLFVPVLEQILVVITFITKVVGEVVGLVKCDVGVFTFMVLLVIIAVVALLSHFVTRRMGSSCGVG